MSARGSHSELYGANPALLSPLAARMLERDWLKWIIVITASFGAILEVIDTSIINVALPDIRGNLGATLSEAGWVSTGYACANVVIIPLTAWLGDRFGKKNYFIFSLVGFTAASILCGIAPNLAFLVIARVLQGLAGGGLLAKAQAIVFEAFPAAERGVAQAIFGLGIIAGPALGPVLGGLLTDNIGWRWIFFINIPFGILAVVMCVVFLPHDEEGSLKTGTVDWLGIGLLAIGLGCLQTMLEEGQQDDWFESRFITSMGLLSCAGITLFIWRELNTEHPAVDLRVLRHRSMMAGSLFSAVLGFGIFGILFAIPVFVQDYLHFTAAQSGYLQVPGAVAAAVAMMVFGKINNRFDPRLLVTVGSVLTVGTGLLLARINPDTSADTLFLPLILRSIGSVMLFMPLSIATLGPLPKRELPAGAGFYSLTRQLGASVGVAIIASLLQRRENLHSAILAEKVTLFRQPALERIQAFSAGFAPHFSDVAAVKQRALALLSQSLQAQALLLSYSDIFLFVAATFFLSMPLILLLGGRGSKDANEAAANSH